ncbi:TPA_exp: putative Homeobox transcription factor [Trichophyton benhamiae CBS 112371]|nr:TPA_exp: putative Homeobox transcription factor [Trichophyton benhamiae CBS 112371]
MSTHEVYTDVSGWTNTRIGDQLPSPQLHNYHPSTMMMQFCESPITDSLKQEPDATPGQCDIRGLAYLKAAEQGHSSQDPSDSCYMGSHKGSQGDLSCSDLTDALQSSSASSCPGSPQTPGDGEQQSDSGHIDSKQEIYSPATEDVEIHDADDEPKPTGGEKIDRKKMKRFRLTHNQTRYLMSEFTRQAHPDAAHRERLSREIPGLSPRQVQVWFQNRRAKLKRLSLDDRERVLKSRALPDDFDMAQSLQSSYATEHHGYTTPLVSPGTFFPPEENDPYGSARAGTAAADDYTTSPLSSTSAYGSYFGRDSSAYSRGSDSISSMSTSSDSIGSFGSLPSANPSIHGRMNFVPRSFGEQQGAHGPSVPQLHMYNTSLRARAGSLNLPMRGTIPCHTPPLEYTDTDSSTNINNAYGSRSLDASTRRDPFGLEEFKQKTVGQPVTATPRIGEGSPPKADHSRAAAVALQSAPLQSTQEEDQLSGLGPQFNLSSFGITYPRQSPSTSTNNPTSHPSSKSSDMHGAYNNHGTAWLQQTIQQKLSCYPEPDYSAPRQRGYFYQSNTETI